MAYPSRLSCTGLKSALQRSGRKPLIGTVRRRSSRCTRQAALRSQTSSESNPLAKADEGLRINSRAYTGEQVELIYTRLSDRSALSVRLAYASGLRTHELLTLTPREQNVHTSVTTRMIVGQVRRPGRYRLYGERKKRAGAQSSYFVPAGLGTRKSQTHPTQGRD